ncbi:MAG: hypothetical protein K9J25_12580 [Bacteroidales bacterium]|nr:hypothetical protein [Bacteroidales bacterium]
MKKLILLFAIIVIAASIGAQTPQSFNYQAIFRDADGSIKPNASYVLIISILQGSITGTEVFTETMTGNTNNYGLITEKIGLENPTDFQLIDWSNSPYFLSTNINGVPMGTTQLLSVPYALYANTTDSIIGGVGIRETDPLFGTSVASGITETDSTYWNNKLDMEVDGSITNEIQDLELTDNILRITNNVLATEIDLSNPNVYSPETDTLFVVKDNDENAVFTVFPDGATALGFGSVTNAEQSMAIGVRDTASAINSLAMGVGSNATGTASIAIGSYVEANTTGSLVVGQLNNPFGTTDLWNTNDPLIVVGNGIFGIPGILSTAVRSNAFTILKNGNIGVGIDTPQRRVHIKDVMRIEPSYFAPNSPSEGDIYFDGIIKKLMVYDGTIWQACW